MLKPAFPLSRIAGYAAAVMGLLGSSPAWAGPAGTLIGVFSNPIYAGNILNNPTVGQSAFFDNSASAPASTFITSGGSQLQWGTDPGAGLPDSQQFSTLSFSGASAVPTNTATPVLLGTLNYLNGTSDLGSIIFGATISFYLNSTSPANLVATDTVFINTTSNQYSGTGLLSDQLQTDADYVSICGNSSNICGNSIEAFEDSEGGVGFSVNLYGTIAGDPQLTLTSVDATPGQDPATSGEVGEEPALAVPEPSSIAILAAGLVGLAMLRRRRTPALMLIPGLRQVLAPGSRPLIASAGTPS